MSDERRYTVKLDKDFHKSLRHKALDEEISLAEAVRGLLRLWLEGKVKIPTAGGKSS